MTFPNLDVMDFPNGFRKLDADFQESLLVVTQSIPDCGWFATTSNDS